MANHTSAKKAIRKIKKRTEINRSHKSRIHTFIRKVEDAISAGNKQQALEAFKLAEPEIMKGVTHGFIKINTAARKISRLSAKVKAIAS